LQVITDIVVREAGREGKGVFARRDFNQGEFIFRRRHGRVISMSEVDTLSEEDRRHLCELDFETTAVLLSPGCYLNHSCDPNAMRRGVKIFAWKEIREGDEIRIDYRLNAFGGESSTCLCGSANCDGQVVWSFFALDERLQRIYLPYAPDFIRAEYRRRCQEPHVPKRQG
jgi:SET domain-containing protein